MTSHPPTSLGSLSLVIPAYNEAAGICSTLDTISAYMVSRSDDYEIIVVDDGSQDRTSQVVNDWILSAPQGSVTSLIRLDQNLGKGGAVRAGILASRKDWIVFMDADCPFELSVLDEIKSALRTGADLAIGTRVWKGARPSANVPVIRFISGNIYSVLIQVVVAPGVWDTQCGLKGFSADTARRLFSRLTLRDFAFDVELLFLARKDGCCIRQVPVTQASVRRESRVRLVRDSIRMLVDLFIIRWNDLLGRYAVEQLPGAHPSKWVDPPISR